MSQGFDDSYRARVAKYYDPLLEGFENSHRTVGWIEPHLQTIRFEMLAQVTSLETLSVLDVGCGLGHFYDFITERGFQGHYTGVDIQSSMIERAKAAHDSAANADFYEADFLAEPDRFGADVVVASGLFHLGGHEDMERTIATMFGRARRAIAFNSLSALSPIKTPPTFLFADPVRIFEFCTELSPLIVFRHDYLPQDFSIYLFRR